MNLEQKLNKAIELGNIVGAKKLATIKFQNEDKQAWDKARSDEYDLLFPKYRDMTTNEMAQYDEEYNEFGMELNGLNYPQVNIDYSEDETYLAYEEWISETKVVSEAVEATYDEDGMELTPAKAEATELVRLYIAPDVTERVNNYPAIVAKLVKLEKVKKTTELDELVVEHNTVAYDANGAAIGNMASVVAVAGFKYNQATASGTSPAEAYQTIYKDTLIGWKNVSNEISMVQVESVAEALEKSMTRLAEIIGAK